MFNRWIETDGLRDFAAENGVGLAVFQPLFQGLLTDRYLHGIPADSRVHTDGRWLKESALSPELLGRIAKLNDLAAARGQTLAEMALAWLLAKEEITSVLIGASRPSQILDNIKAVENTGFTAEELAEIDRLSV